MDKQLWSWLVNLIQGFANMSEWLTTPVKYINLSPLALLTASGISFVIILHAWHLLKIVG